MFQFMLVVGLVLAYYGYAVTKNPRIWGDQGRDAIKEENWNRYVRYNGQFAMYAGFLMAALDALDMAVDLSAAIYLLILLGGLAILLYPFAHWMHENEGTWNPWPRVETEKQFRTAYLFHIRSGSKDLGFFLLYFNLDTRLLPQTYKLYESFGSHLGIAVDSLRLVEREQQYAVVQERNLMAQGLHDSIAQSLSFLNLQVQLLESGLHTDDKELVDTTVAQIKAGVQESYEDVRELLLNFRERVHTESFSEAINTVIDRFESQTKLPVKLTVTGPEVELTDRQKIQVIFIMQEALANVRKHSKATQVLINIEYGAEFKLSVVDNGIGINQDILKKRSKRHVGLNIMGERAQRIGAKVTVQNVSQDLFESGTCVQLVISETTVEDRSSRRSSAAASSED